LPLEARCTGLVDTGATGSVADGAGGLSTGFATTATVMKSQWATMSFAKT